MLCVRMYAVCPSQMFVNMRCRIHSLYTGGSHPPTPVLLSEACASTRGALSSWTSVAAHLLCRSRSTAPARNLRKKATYAGTGLTESLGADVENAWRGARKGRRSSKRTSREHYPSQRLLKRPEVDDFRCRRFTSPLHYPCCSPFGPQGSRQQGSETDFWLQLQRKSEPGLCSLGPGALLRLPL